MRAPENGSWRVPSKVRAKGTKTVVAFVLETEYDRKSGEITIKERRYNEDYATFFKRSPEHKAILLMISPKMVGWKQRWKFTGTRNRVFARNVSHPSERSAHGTCGMAGQEPAETIPVYED